MKNLSRKKLQKVVKVYQKEYPEQKELFFTPDGNCFLDKTDAKNHAVMCESEVITVPAGEDLPEDKEEVTPTDEAKAAANKVLLELDLSEEDKVDYQLVKDLVKALELEAEGKSKEAYINALVPVKRELKELKREE